MRQLNIYFIHPSGLKEREQTIANLQKQLQKYQFKNVRRVGVRVITEYDPNAIPGELIGKAVNYAPISEPDDLKEENKTQSITFYNQFIKNMHLFQLSAALKHYKALELIANSEPGEVNIVLEDDVIYEERACLLIDRLIQKLPSEYDMIFMGLPSNREIKNRNEVSFQSVSEVFRVLPFADAYLVSQQAAKKLYDEFLPIKFVGHLQLSYLMEKLNFKPVLCTPNVFINGSVYGMYLSTVNPNNVLIFNNEYMRLRGQATKEEPLTQQEVAELDEICEKSPIKGNPDFMYAKALYMTKQKKYKEAEKLYESAIQIYLANNCIVNHESHFLKDYIRLHKHMQDI